MIPCSFKDMKRNQDTNVTAFASKMKYQISLRERKLTGSFGFKHCKKAKIRPQRITAKSSKMS